MSSSLHLDTGNGHQCQRKRNCSFLSYHYRGLMSSWRCWVSHFWQEFNISIISLLTNLCWQVEIWFFLISNWNSANFCRLYILLLVARLCSVCTAGQVQKKRKCSETHQACVVFLWCFWPEPSVCGTLHYKWSVSR